MAKVGLRKRKKAGPEGAFLFPFEPSVFLMDLQGKARIPWRFKASQTDFLNL